MIYIKTIYVSSMRIDDGCVYCGGKSNTWDHINPRWNRGKDNIENLVPACRKCNSTKGNRPLQDFLKKIGRQDLVIPIPHVVSVRIYAEKKHLWYRGTSHEKVSHSGNVEYVTDDPTVVITSKDDIFKRVFSGALKSRGAQNWHSSLF